MDLRSPNGNGASPRDKAPLHRFPALSTTSLDHWEYVLKEKYGVRGLDVPHRDNVWTRGNYLGLNDLTLGYSAVGPSCVVEYEEAELARLRLVLASSVESKIGSRRTDEPAGCLTVTSPGEAYRSSYGSNVELLFLWINSPALLKKLTALTGLSPRHRLVFDPTEFTSPQLANGLRKMIESLAHQFDDANASISPIAVREQEQAIIVQFLLATRHSFSSILEQDDDSFIPGHVRRVAEYIEASWNHPVTIEDLVEIGGVSARTLFKAFAKTYGSSPMAFAKQQRLQRARCMLMQGSTSVTSVAVDCSFSNLGHFAADYRKQFGELPSQTLSRRQS